jgi:hypothetical protein
VLDWLDSVLPSDATAATIPFPVSTEWHLSAIRWWDLEFWNRSVTLTYVAPDGNFTYTPFPTRTLELDWSTGIAAGTADAPPYVVTAPGDSRFRLEGSRHAANVGLEVTAVVRPYRALWASQGLDPDGWTRRARPATIRVYGRQSEAAQLVEVEIALQAPAGAPALYNISAPADVRAGPLFAGTMRSEVVSVCVPARSTADVTVTGWSNARVVGPPLGPEVESSRAVGVGVNSVTVRAKGLDCVDARPE